MPYPIETYNLTKRFPVIKRYRDLLMHPFRRKEVTALHNVNLQVKEGELFGLLGPNGAGKTTLIKTLCTLVLPTSGQAFVNGLDVSKNGKRVRRAIGYVIDDERSFYWRLSGRQNLYFFAKLNNIKTGVAVKKIDSLMSFMELTSDADRLFKDYSTGMRQKLAIARGLLTDPEIMFMDEPTNRLDPLTAQNLKTLVKNQLVREEGKTVVLATHNLQDAEELCDRIAVIHHGEIKLAGTVEEVRVKFNRNKIYVMELEGHDDGFIGKIQQMSLVKKVVSSSLFSDGIRIELEIKGGNTNITSIIQKIINHGGKLLSLREKESSLRELFSRMIDNS